MPSNVRAVKYRKIRVRYASRCGEIYAEFRWEDQTWGIHSWMKISEYILGTWCAKVDIELQWFRLDSSVGPL